MDARTTQTYSGDRLTPRIVKLIDLSSDGPAGPLHLRLARRIRSLIAEGQLGPGDKLPASRMLALGLGISRNSVTAAIDALVADGLLEARRGSGVRVAATTAPLSAIQAPPPAFRCVEDGGEPLPFALGVPGLDLFPMERWAQLQARRWRSLSGSALREGYGAGWSGLREAIASHLATSRGLSCLPSQVFVTTSARAAMDLTVRALRLQGSSAWVEDPGYLAPRGALRAHDLIPVPIPVDEEGLRVDLGRLNAPDARLAIVTPAAQFPLGVEMSDVRRQALLDWSHQTGGWILEDDYDAEFRFEGRARRPIAHAPDAGRVIYVHSFNKTLFPTLRIACLIAPTDLIDAVVRARDFVDGHSNVPNQMVLADFINGGHLDAHLIRCRGAYAERREALIAGVGERLDGRVALAPRPGGLHLIGRLIADSEAGFVARAAARRLDLSPMRVFTEAVVRPPEVLFGFAGFQPRAISSALARLAAAG